MEVQFCSSTEIMIVLLTVLFHLVHFYLRLYSWSLILVVMASRYLADINTEHDVGVTVFNAER